MKIYITLHEYMDLEKAVEKHYLEYRENYPLVNNDRYLEPEHSCWWETTNSFHFATREDLERFFQEYSFEVFGKCDPKTPISKLNKTYYQKVNEGHDVCVLAQGFENIIPNTMIFLASNQFICNNIKFVMDYERVDADEFITKNRFLRAKNPRDEFKYSIGISELVDRPVVRNAFEGWESKMTDEEFQEWEDEFRQFYLAKYGDIDELYMPTYVREVIDREILFQLLNDAKKS